MARLSFCLLAVLLACGSSGAQQSSKAARETVQTIGQLRAIELPDRARIQFGPPAEVPGLLRLLNRQLRTLIIEVLTDQNRRNEVADSEEVFSELRKAGWNEIPDHKWNAYGEIIQISFDWKLGYDPGLLVVSTQLWIPCGSSDPDSAIYVFQGRARKWNLVLASDADYDGIRGSEESGMQYEISPPDSRGKWFLAIANSPPSCRSAQATLRYKVLRPGRSADEPLTLLDRRVPVIRDFDPPFRLRVEEEWVSLTQGKDRKLDGATGVTIARYEVGGAQVKRIQPLALTPEDFLDEWVQLEWDEASRWSNASHQTELEQWHAKLNGFAYDSVELESVKQCPGEKDFDGR